MGLLMFCLSFNSAFVQASDYEQEFGGEARAHPCRRRRSIGFAVSTSVHARVTFKLSEDPNFIVKVLVRCDSEALIPVSAESFLRGCLFGGFFIGYG